MALVRQYIALTSTATSLTWTVPSDWNNASNSIHVVGAGGGGGGGYGAGSNVTYNSGGGGGGGGYSSLTNVVLVPGTTISYKVGQGGAGGAGGVAVTTSPGLAGGATYFTTSAGATPTFVNSASTQNVANSSIVTLAVPSGYQAGDMLIAVITDNALAGTISPVSPISAGWTYLAPSVINAGLQVFWKIATASEPASYNFNEVAATRILAGTMMVYRGAGSIAQDAAATATTTPGSQVTTFNNSIVFQVGATTVVSTTIGTPAGFTSLVTNADTTAPSYGIFYKNVATAATNAGVAMTSATKSIAFCIGPSAAVWASGGSGAIDASGGYGYPGGGTYRGGLGGLGSSAQGGGGGGGAAGPRGNGGDGGFAGGSTAVGSGGGGGSGGGSAGGSASATQSGAGGNNQSGTGGGAAKTVNGAGNTGTAGGGGGGAFTSLSNNLGYTGGSGSNSTDIGGGYGSGGGAAGSNGTAAGTNTATAGFGGGGSGGGSYQASTAPTGNGWDAGGGGGNGLIVIVYDTYNPYTVDTNFFTTDPNTNQLQDLGSRYLTKSYLLDAYPNIASQLGARTSPGLWAWGMNQSPSNPNVRGALGNNTNVNYSSPIQVGSLTGWRQVSSGGFQSMAVKTDGSLWGWGSNGIAGLAYNNAVGLNTTAAYSSPVQVGALTNWRQVSAGYAHTLAVKTDGTLWAWGYNINDAIGLPCAGVLGINNVTNTYSSPVQVGAVTNWRVVAAGVFQSFAIQNTGSLWAWGFNNYGQLGINTAATQYYSSPVQVGALTNWKQISASNSTTAAIKTDGTLWAWGNNTSGQLGIGTNSATVYYSSPVQVGALTGWKIVSIGSDSALVTYAAAIKTDGTLWTWGNNTYGQLGLNTLTYYSSPVQVGALTNWKYVSAGRGTTYAVKTDGTLWAWGLNQMGQMGNNNTVYYSSPVQVGALTTWKSVGNNMTYHSLAIADGYI